MKLLCLVLASSVMCFAAGELIIGERPPDLKGKFLTGRNATLPDAASGKVALLLFGFSYDSRHAVEAWTKRFRGDFDKASEVTFYEIPMIGGMARMAKWFIDSGMRRGTPKSDQENVVTVYGGTGQWKERLGVTDEKLAYLVLIDQKGNVVWRHGGPFEEGQYNALSEQVRRLLQVQ